MKKAWLIVLGLIPFMAGGCMNWLILHVSFALPLAWIGIGFLFLWGLLAFFANAYVGDCKVATLYLNLVAAFVLLLLGVQLGLVGSYWDWIGAWTQFFYLPVLPIGFAVTNWSHSVSAAYIASFLLMVLVSILGCKLQKNKS